MLLKFSNETFIETFYYFLVVNHGMGKIDTELGDRLDWAINQQFDGLFIRISNS